MCIYDAATRAGYAPTTALTKGKRLDQASNIRGTLEVMGMTDDVVVNTLKECLVADKAIVCDKEVSMIPDHPTRLKTAETVMKLKGHLDKEVALTGVTNIQVNFNLVGDDGKSEGQDSSIELPSFTEAAISPESTERPEHS
jgi:hypothetical protein